MNICVSLCKFKFLFLMGGQAVWQVNVNFKTLPKVLSSGTDIPQRYCMVPDHSNKANIAIKRKSYHFFGFSVHIKLHLHYTVMY